MPMLALSAIGCAPMKRRRGQGVEDLARRSARRRPRSTSRPAAPRIRRRRSGSPSRIRAPPMPGARAARRSTWSPTAWPRVSLICLKPSRSRNSRPTRAALRCARAIALCSRSSISTRVVAPVSSSCWVERVSSSRLLTAVCAAVSACTAACTSRSFTSSSCAVRRPLQLLLRLLGLAPQAGEVGAHRVRLGLEQRQGAACGGELFLFGGVGHGATHDAPRRPAPRRAGAGSRALCETCHTPGARRARSGPARRR